MKEKSRGRAIGGGLALFIKKKHHVNILKKNNFWILARVEMTMFEFILGIIYLTPASDIK